MSLLLSPTELSARVNGEATGIRTRKWSLGGTHDVHFIMASQKRPAGSRPHVVSASEVRLRRSLSHVLDCADLDDGRKHNKNGGESWYRTRPVGDKAFTVLPASLAE